MTTTLPAGWKLMPIEPTTEILKALRYAVEPDSAADSEDAAREVWAAMLAAAPTPPATTQDDPITVALDPDPRGVSVGVWQGSSCIYTGAHAVPEGALPARDWELSCNECNGSGHVFVKHQVAERKTDVQEFKEECECCEGRGFTIAFEDIPGIAEYVKSCRAPSAPKDAKKVYHFEQRSRFGPWIEVEKPTAKSVEFIKRSAAPAAGDALDAARLDWLEQHDSRFYNKDRISSIVGTGFLVAGDGHGIRHQTVRAAIDAAIAAQRKGDA